MNTYWANNFGWHTKTCKASNQTFQKKQADVFYKGSCGCYLMLTPVPAAHPSKSKTPFFYSKAGLYSHCSLESHNHYKRETTKTNICHSQGIEGNFMTDWGNSIFFFPWKIEMQIVCFCTDRCLCQRRMFFIIFISYTASHYLLINKQTVIPSPFSEATCRCF